MQTLRKGMMFKINEIKAWAKKHDITIKKQDEGFVWNEDQNPLPLENVVKNIFNKITDNKYKEHQQNYIQHER